jgi:ribosomal protein L11 methyltransferase
MSWIELSLNTTHEAVDWVCTLLATVDYPGNLQIAQEANQSAWAFAICLYLPNDYQARTQVDTIAKLLSPLHRTGMTTELEIAIVETKPSAECNLLAHRIGKRFVVLNSDQPFRSQADDILLRLGTNLSFGSGLHPATILSLQLLERHVVPTMNALDLGSGSGILSIAMAKLGAQVLAIDNDSTAVQSTQDAVKLNQLEQQITVKQGSLGRGSELGHWMGGDVSEGSAIQPNAAFDLIMANILARVHIALAPDFQRAIAPTGLLITSGFTSDHEAEVSAALREVGFETVDGQRSAEWVALAHRLIV